jgi:uncharacterized repeat protein (TIGR01451 family)
MRMAEIAKPQLGPRDRDVSRGAHARVPRLMPYWLALALVAFAYAPDAQAACSCGFDDGSFTLITEAIDGTFSGAGSGWDEVHADTDNNVCDGPPATDLDAGDLTNDSRDITWFAYSWDANYIYFFTERVSSAGVQRFIYYADEDGDGLMESGEQAIGVTWQNSGVTIQRFTYVESAAGGDPTSDGGGVADGWELAGTLTGPDATLDAGAQNGAGTQIEFRVAWDRITGDNDGVNEVTDGPAAVQFHVSSMNASFGGTRPPDNIEDDLSGCGGGVGSSQFGGVDIAPDRSVTVTHTSTHPQNVTTCLAHTVTNTGNGDDVFNITSSALPAGITSVTFYFDVNGNGTYESGTDTQLTDEPEPETPISLTLVDESDSIIDTDVLAAAAVKNILACYVVALTNAYTPTDGDLVVTLTATSGFEPLISDTVTDTITIATIADPAVVKSSAVVSDPVNGASNPKRIPGAFVDYTVTVTNDGGHAIDDDLTIITDTIPAGTDLFVNSLGGTPAGPVDQTDGAPACGLVAAGLTVLFSKTVGVLVTDPDSSFAASVTPDGNGVDSAVTAIRIKPDGIFAARSAPTAPSCTWRYRVRVE